MTSGPRIHVVWRIVKIGRWYFLLQSDFLWFWKFDTPKFKIFDGIATCNSWWALQPSIGHYIDRFNGTNFTNSLRSAVTHAIPERSPMQSLDRVDLISTSELAPAFAALLQASKWSNYRENAFLIGRIFNFVTR